jgi:cytochrome P450
VAQAVEEWLRWEPPLLSFGRIATVGTEIAGQPIAAGTTVNLCVSHANRDPGRWDDADDVHIAGLASRTAVRLPCVWKPGAPPEEPT